MIKTFIVEGQVKGKARARANTKTGHMYTPKGTQNYEAWVKSCYVHRSGGEMLQGDITALIEAYYKIPASIKSKTKREQMRRGIINPTIKPDTDNVAKIILDALNGIAYEDDKQIIDLRVIKRYADEPFVKITLEGD